MYNLINTHRVNLIEDKQRDPTVNPPFYWHHVRPEVQRAAIREVWQRAPANSAARRLFDLGATDGEGAPNWVTHWLLYSVFRARDDRNNRHNRNRRSVPDGKSRGVGRVLLPFPNCSVRLLTEWMSSNAVESLGNLQVTDPHI